MSEKYVFKETEESKRRYRYSITQTLTTHYITITISTHIFIKQVRP